MFKKQENAPENAPEKESVAEETEKFQDADTEKSDGIPAPEKDW